MKTKSNTGTEVKTKSNTGTEEKTKSNTGTEVKTKLNLRGKEHLLQNFQKIGNKCF